MVQQNSTTLPLTVNPKLWDASLLLWFKLCGLKCLLGFLVSCRDEMTLSTLLQHADKALTIKCWLAQFYFACVMLVSHPMRNQSPSSFCRTGFCMYLQWALVWPAGKNDFGSQDGGQETKICALFCREFKAEREEEQPSLGSLLEALVRTLRLPWMSVASQEASVMLLGGGLWLFPRLGGVENWI